MHRSGTSGGFSTAENRGGERSVFSGDMRGVRGAAVSVDSCLCKGRRRPGCGQSVRATTVSLSQGVGNEPIRFFGGHFACRDGGLQKQRERLQKDDMRNFGRGTSYELRNTEKGR
jgi:hypothetical protein